MLRLGFRVGIKCVRVVTAGSDGAAGLPRPPQLFRCSHVGLRDAGPRSPTRYLALVPFDQSFVHSDSSTASQTMASVVSMREATEAAFCNAVRVTLVGSITPAFTRSSYVSVYAL
jgi:hypothetical protein